MNLVRHELGQSKTKERFPKKDTCVAIYSLAVNSRAALKTILTKQFPWCSDWEDELGELFTLRVCLTVPASGPSPSKDYCECRETLSAL